MKLSEHTALYSDLDWQYNNAMSGPYIDYRDKTDDGETVAGLKNGRISGAWRPCVCVGTAKYQKSEIKRLALSLSRLKGENANLGLIEKHLRNENLSYEELCHLKNQLKSEFDKNFSTAPLSKTIYPFSEGKRAKDKIEEFKV